MMVYVQYILFIMWWQQYYTYVNFQLSSLKNNGHVFYYCIEGGGGGSLTKAVVEIFTFWLSVYAIGDEVINA